MLEACAGSANSRKPMAARPARVAAATRRVAREDGLVALGLDELQRGIELEAMPTAGVQGVSPLAAASLARCRSK